MKSTLVSRILPLAIVAFVLSNFLNAQETEYNWTNATGSSNWFHEGNWGIDDGTPDSNSIANIINTPAGNVQFAGSATVRTLNIGVNAGLNLTSGSLTFSARTGSAPFAMQNSGEINIYGDDASMQLKDEMHNFSSKVINLFDGASLELTGGNALVNTSNLDTGNGVINMSSAAGEPESKITGFVGSILTLEKQTIQGHGLIGEGNLAFIFGTDTIVDANVSGKSFVFDTSGFSNGGILRASNGGSLDFLDQVINNTGGQIEALAGSSVVLSNGFDITGGVLREVGTGIVTINGSGRLANLTLDGLDLVFDGGRDLTLAGTITNAGSISMINPGNATTDLRIDGATQLTGGGTVTLGGPNTTLSRIIDPSGADGVLTNINNTIQGKGNVGSNSVQIINQAGGTIDANDSTGSLTLAPVTSSSFINRGLLTASNGGTLIFGSGQYDNAGAVIDLQDGSTINFGSGATITGGIVRDLGTGEYVSSSAATLADLTVQGELSIKNGNDIRLVGTIRNEGEISAINPGNANTDMLIDGATRFEGGGTVTLGGLNTTLSRIIDPSGTDESSPMLITPFKE